MGLRKRSRSARSHKIPRCRPANCWHRGKKILLVVLLGLSVSTGAAGLASWTRTAPLFELSAIDVGGNRFVSSQIALEMIPVEKGTNIFAVDLEAIERAMERDPRIREATIRRQLPSKIVITIREREPVMLLSADELYGVDQEGTVIPLEKGQELEDIPVLTGIFPEVQPGAGYEHLGIRRGLEIRQAILQVAPSLLDKISEINVARPEVPLLYLVQGGAQVRMGSGDLHAKFRRLWTVLGDLSAKGISVKSLDLRFKDQIICQPAP
jgi:cell division protein FtsQ